MWRGVLPDSLWRRTCGPHLVYPTQAASMPGHPSLTLTRSKSYTWGVSVGKQCHKYPGSHSHLPGSVSKRDWWWHGQDNWWLEKSGLQWNWPFRTGGPRLRWYLLPLSEHQSSQEPPRNGKKQKNYKHDGNSTFDEIANIAWQIQHQPLARELSGIIKEILEAA